jgi:hypothetical protein
LQRYIKGMKRSENTGTLESRKNQIKWYYTKGGLSYGFLMVLYRCYWSLCLSTACQRRNVWDLVRETR